MPKLKVPRKLQLTGNSGLYFAAWHLSRRGWHVMPTVRNAAGSDLIVTNDDESVYFGVQSKALSKLNPVPLGKSLEKLRSEWWIITVNANGDDPVCFIMSVAEVRAGAYKDTNGGAYWLQQKAYNQVEFREAWGRFGSADIKAALLPEMSA
jgi:hypothetical protein